VIDTRVLGGVLVVLAAALSGVIVLLVVRMRASHHRDDETETLALGTRRAIAVRLPTVLNAQSAAERVLSWPPVRVLFVDLTTQWEQLADDAADRRGDSEAGNVAALLQDLVAAVDAENEALATGYDWQSLRPRLTPIMAALDDQLTKP
jgi:hypothetical protein